MFNEQEFIEEQKIRLTYELIDLFDVFLVMGEYTDRQKELMAEVIMSFARKNSCDIDKMKHICKEELNF